MPSARGAAQHKKKTGRLVSSFLARQGHNVAVVELRTFSPIFYTLSERHIDVSRDSSSVMVAFFVALVVSGYSNPLYMRWTRRCVWIGSEITTAPVLSIALSLFLPAAHQGFRRAMLPNAASRSTSRSNGMPGSKQRGGASIRSRASAAIEYVGTYVQFGSWGWQSEDRPRRRGVLAQPYQLHRDEAGLARFLSHHIPAPALDSKGEKGGIDQRVRRIRPMGGSARNGPRSRVELWPGRRRYALRPWHHRNLGGKSQQHLQSCFMLRPGRT